MRLKTMTLFLWSEMKAKRGKEGEGGKDKGNKDWWREQSLTETALMIPHSVSQLQIKTTSTRKQSRSPELQNNLIGSAGCYKCVGGWVYLLWSILFSVALPIASHFQFMILCFKYLDIEFVSIPIRHLLKYKQVDKLTLSVHRIASFHAVSLSGLGWEGVMKTRWGKDISAGNPSQAGGGPEAPRYPRSPRSFRSLCTASGKTNITVFISGSLGGSNGGCTLQDSNISVAN